MICFLDIDGVLANFTEGVFRHFGIKYDYANLPRPMNWMWYPDFGLTTEEVDSICTIDFWAGLRWMHDGREILRLVEEKFGHENIYLMSCPMSNPQSATGKMLWIERYLPKYERRTIITQASKRVFASWDKILIDDRTQNVDLFLKNEGQAILIARPWNTEHKYSTETISVLKSELERINV